MGIISLLGEPHKKDNLCIKAGLWLHIMNSSHVSVVSLDLYISIKI